MNRQLSSLAEPLLGAAFAAIVLLSLIHPRNPLYTLSPEGPIPLSPTTPPPDFP